MPQIDPRARVRGYAAGRECNVPGCDRDVRCIGLCSRHYDLQRRTAICPACGGRMASKSSRCVKCFDSQWVERPSTRRCTQCRKVKDIETEFGWRTDGNGRRKPRAWCRDCDSADAARRWSETMRKPGEREKRAKARRESDQRRMAVEGPEAGTRRRLLASARGLGVSVEEVAARYDEVGNVCEACGTPGTHELRGRVQVDHCHATGAFRGLLCRRCNATAGMASDDPVVLGAILQYLDDRRPIGVV